MTEESYQRWDAFCTRRGVTMASLMEALGERFAVDNWVPEGVVARARQIDRDRGSRR